MDTANQMKIKTRLFWVILIALLPGGCSGYQAPSIAVRDAMVTDITAEALALDFALDLTNSNDEELKLLWFDYRLSLGSHHVYTGRRAAEATLSANSTKQLTIPGVVPFADVGWQMEHYPDRADYALTGSLLYITPGQIAEVLLDTGVRKPRVSFAATGTVDLRR